MNDRIIHTMPFIIQLLNKFISTNKHYTTDFPFKTDVFGFQFKVVFVLAVFTII